MRLAGHGFPQVLWGAGAAVDDGCAGHEALFPSVLWHQVIEEAGGAAGDERQRKRWAGLSFR